MLLSGSNQASILCSLYEDINEARILGYSKYKNKKIIQQILGTIATIITSSFSIIDYHNKDIHGKDIQIESRFIIEETLIYVLLI